MFRDRQINLKDKLKLLGFLCTAVRGSTARLIDSISQRRTFHRLDRASANAVLDWYPQHVPHPRPFFSLSLPCVVQGFFQQDRHIPPPLVTDRRFVQRQPCLRVPRRLVQTEASRVLPVHPQVQRGMPLLPRPPLARAHEQVAHAPPAVRDADSEVREVRARRRLAGLVGGDERCDARGVEGAAVDAAEAYDALLRGRRGGEGARHEQPPTIAVVGKTRLQVPVLVLANVGIEGIVAEGVHERAYDRWYFWRGGRRAASVRADVIDFCHTLGHLTRRSSLTHVIRAWLERLALRWHVAHVYRRRRRHRPRRHRLPLPQFRLGPANYLLLQRRRLNGRRRDRRARRRRAGRDAATASGVPPATRRRGRETQRRERTTSGACRGRDARRGRRGHDDQQEGQRQACRCRSHKRQRGRHSLGGTANASFYRRPVSVGVAIEYYCYCLCMAYGELPPYHVRCVRRLDGSVLRGTFIEGGGARPPNEQPL